MGREYLEPDTLFGPNGRSVVALFPIGFRHSNSVALPSPREGAYPAFKSAELPCIVGSSAGPKSLKLSTCAPLHSQHRGSSR